MTNITLEPSALQQLHQEQKALLDAIDDLRKHGVGRFVDLPQIIVVGDQSSGKSSVLEAISRVRFPVKDGLCTRFATELVLRTDSQVKVDVRIQPSLDSDREIHSFDEKSFNKEELPRIIEKAKKKMLSGDAGFSEDVLRIEITSPDVPHLTMVDLPGFYHSEDENQSAAGREIVDRLAERYMARKNSIILAVVSARNQVVLQKVLSKVKYHDAHRERTLGIITKPDILVSGSQDEANFIRLAKNLDKSHELSLGWHVLRNRAETETSDSDDKRDEKERRFFESSLWSNVPSSNRGVDALRKKLSGVLLKHIKNNLQGLIDNIEEKIKDRETQIKRLGEPRSTPKELRAHLDKMASQFHVLCLHAVEGNYNDEFFGGLYPGDEVAAINDTRIRKLRALLRDLNRTFAYILEAKGSRRIILPKISSVFPDEDIDDEDSAPGEFGGFSRYIQSLSKRFNGPVVPAFLQSLAKQYEFKNPKKVNFEDIASDLESLSSANQGSEFPGTSNDRLAVKLFQDQSQPWEAIARCHLRLVLRMTKAFVEKLVDHITSSDKRTAEAILTEIVDPFFDEKSVVLEAKLQELLLHYKSGLPQPLDAEFRALLELRQRRNLGGDTIRDLMKGRPELFTKEAHLEFEQTVPLKSVSEFGVESLIDKAEIYYEMSLRTFTDNMIVLAVENCLIRDLPSIFTTSKVNGMEDSELELLASESPEIQIERKELQAEHDALKKGLKICNKFRERKTTYEAVSSIAIEPEVSSKAKDSKKSDKKPPAKPTSSTTAGGVFGVPNASPRPSEPVPSLFSSLGTSDNSGNPTLSLFRPSGANDNSNQSIPSTFFSRQPQRLLFPPGRYGQPADPFPPPSGFGGGSFSPPPEQPPQAPNKFWSPLWSIKSPRVQPLTNPPTERTEREVMQHICFQEPYDKYSPEELRYIVAHPDYTANA